MMCVIWHQNSLSALLSISCTIIAGRVGLISRTFCFSSLPSLLQALLQLSAAHARACQCSCRLSCRSHCRRIERNEHGSPMQLPPAYA